MRDTIAFELGAGRRLDKEKREEIEKFNKMLVDTPVRLQVKETEDFTYILINFDDERK